MRPVAFPEQSCVYGEGQAEYLPLPAHRGPEPQVIVTSCWELSPEDLRELAANGGKIYLQQLTFGDPLQPQLPSVFKPDLA